MTKLKSERLTFVNLNYSNAVRMAVACLLLNFIYPTFLKAQDDQELLLGTWSLDYDATLMNLTNYQKDRLVQLGREGNQQLKTFYRGRQFDFDLNGNFTMYSPSNGTYNGTYKINNSRLVITDNVSNEQIIYEIEKIGNNNLMLAEVNRSNLNLMISTFFYIK